MRIHHLQHVPFEGLGSMGPDMTARGWPLSSTHLYRGDELPGQESFDWLVVMGGPMSIHDEDGHPWLRPEKDFIRAAIDGGKIVLGICLGAQLIADAMGARVEPNAHREIGWFPVAPTPETASTILGPVFPGPAEVFHWHGDRFEIPARATRIAGSEACDNQAFVSGDRIVALQFHLETTPDSARALIENCSDELNGSRYVQTVQEMLASEDRFTRINVMMREVINALAGAGAVTGAEDRVIHSV